MGTRYKPQIYSAQFTYLAQYTYVYIIHIKHSKIK